MAPDPPVSRAETWRERIALLIAPTLCARLTNWQPRCRRGYGMSEWNALTQDQRNRVVAADPEPQP